MVRDGWFAVRIPRLQPEVLKLIYVSFSSYGRFGWPIVQNTIEMTTDKQFYIK